jgi:hypothetical protein
VVHGLPVVAIEVAQEHTVVGRVVLGSPKLSVQNLRVRRHSGVGNRVDGMAVGSAEGQVQFPGLDADGWTEPLPSVPGRRTTKASPCESASSIQCCLEGTVATIRDLGPQLFPPSSLPQGRCPSTRDDHTVRSIIPGHKCTYPLSQPVSNPLLADSGQS